MRKNIKSVAIVSTCALITVYPFAGIAEQENVIHLSFVEAQNIVSQKLAVAKNQSDTSSLLDALEAAKGNIQMGAVIYLQYGDDDALALKLTVLKAADEMQDKSFDPKKRAKAGTLGKVPWPLDGERPESLRGRDLWVSGQDPEEFKESDPELYSYYKPLYDENIRNTRYRQHQRIIRNIRDTLVRDVRNALPASEHKAMMKTTNITNLVNKIICDEHLREELFSESPSGESQGNAK